MMKGATVETSDFEGLLGSLDQSIEKTKRNKRADELGEELRTLDNRLRTVDERLAELARVGGKPERKAIEAIDAMRKQKVAIEAELALIFPARMINVEPVRAPAPRPVTTPGARLSDEGVQEVELVMHSLDDAPDDLCQEDALFLVEEASVRWRILAESIGNPEIAPGILRKCYARIMEFREKRGVMSLRLDALIRATVRDWNDDLARVRRMALEAVEKRRATAEAVIDGVGLAMSKYVTSKDSEDRRLFLHAVRDACKNEDFREEIAVVCRIVRNELEKEGFGFLWDSGKSDEKPEEKEAMTRLALAQRLLRRMIRKGVIGGKHAPREMLHRGFPQNVEGDVVEFIELLERTGAMRTKNSGYGKRSALETAWVPKAERLLAGLQTGVPAVDKWCSA
jgi:hypothetical protein